MKNKFKNYLKLGILLFGISITLLNCQKDDSIINVNENVENLDNGYSISIINKEEVFQNKTIADKISSVLKTKTTTNTSKVTNDEHGFTIHTDNVKYIEKDNYHSYTFYVERSYESNIIENLLLTLKDDGSYKPLLVQYSNENSEQSIDNNTTVNFIELEDNFDYNQLLTMSRDCYIISVKHQGTNDGDTYIDLNDCLQYNPGGCDAIVTWGGDCAQQYNDNSLTDGDTSGGGQNSTDNTDPDNSTDTSNPDTSNTDTSNTDTTGPFSGISGTNTGTDGSTSTGTGETIDNTNNDGVINNNDSCLLVDSNGNCFDVVTSPISLPKPDPHIAKLKALSNNSVIKQKISQLKDGIFSHYVNNYKEDGARFTKTGEDQFSVPREPNYKDNHGVDYTPDYLPNEIVSVHIHQTNFYDANQSPDPLKNSPVFSDGDIIEFLKNIKYIKDNSPVETENVTSILLTATGYPNPTDDPNCNTCGIHGMAFVVKDKTKADQALQALQDLNSKTQFESDFEKDILLEWYEGNCDSDCMVKKLKKFIKKYRINGQTLGIGLYQAVFDSNGNITNWVEL